MKKVFVVVIAAVCALCVFTLGCVHTVLSADKETEEAVIIGRACNELGISPQNTGLVFLSKEYVPWLKGEVCNYAFLADNITYVVGVNRVGEKVIYVDVIEEVESVAAAKEKYCVPAAENT